MTEFISRKYGNDGYEVIIKTDSHEHYKQAEDFARRLIDHAKPVTNADRIRAMTDDELAEFFEKVENAVGNDNRLFRNGWLDWLKQEAKE